jgi:protein-disulfide isomerase
MDVVEAASARAAGNRWTQGRQRRSNGEVYGRKVVCLSLTRTLICCLLAVLAAGCRAQNVPTSLPASPASQLNRRIEIAVRSQFEIPPNVDVSIGAATKSDYPGYQNLPITFTSNGKQTTVSFLLSNDGNTVARLEKYDISRNPAEMISLANRPVRGPATAKVTVVSFDDLECPYCAQMHAEFFPATAEHYKDLVKFVYKDYPLVEIHPWAMHAAVDANCLAGQSPTSYWNYVDYVHSHVADITGATRDPQESFKTLDTLTRDEGRRSQLDATKLSSCIQAQEETQIKASLALGESLGVNGTPTLFINGERISGLLSQQLLWMAIDRALRAAGVQPPEVAAAPSPAAPPQPAPSESK